MESEQANISKKIVVVGHKKADNSPAIYMATIVLSHPGIDHEAQLLLAMGQATEKAGFSSDAMICFPDESFSALRVFNDDFRNIDRREYDPSVASTGACDYSVKFECVISAEDPKEAAVEALYYMNDLSSSATFTVTPLDDPDATPFLVDASEDEDNDELPRSH